MADGTEIVGISSLLDGFEQAFARWQEVEHAPQEPARTFIPLFEVLEWTACIDERLGYPDWAPHLRGLRWARHRSRHDWALALEVRSWDEWKLAPNVVREPAPDDWTWRERLPEAKPRSNRKDEPYYVRHLAGQPARIALNLMKRLFLHELRPHYPKDVG